MNRFTTVSLLAAALLAASGSPPPSIEVHFAPEAALAETILPFLRDLPRDAEVQVAMYTLTDPAIVEALVAHAGRVRLIVDHGQYANIPEMGEAVRRLRAAGAQVRFFCSEHFRCSEGHPDLRTFFHHKFAVLGRDVVITGSANWTQSALQRGGNFENLVVLRDADAARAFRAEFDRIWNLRDSRIRPSRPGEE
jgi:phosphatidylserine/phosphatidylglycerophosphate/cardiolipin synthase-like enzyme